LERRPADAVADRLRGAGDDTNPPGAPQTVVGDLVRDRDRLREEQIAVVATADSATDCKSV
jgi:hypothetical protein